MTEDPKTWDITKVLIAIQTSIMLGAVPWAFMVGSSMARIEQQMQALDEVPKQLQSLTERIVRNEERLSQVMKEVKKP